MTTKFHYKIAPVSASVFSQLEVDELNQPMPGKSAQNVNVDNLSEMGLHKALHVLKNRIDPNDLGTAREAWNILPANPTSKLNPDLQKKYSETTLRALLKSFLIVWFDESKEKRPIDQLNPKFKNIRGWPAYHTVSTQLDPKKQQLVLTPYMELQPEHCTKSLRELRKNIDDLAAEVRACEMMTDATDKANCHAGVGKRVLAMENK